MISVNVKQLTESIHEAKEFALPEMNPGTNYLYNNLYKPLSYGNDVTLSSLDFGNFDANDIDSINSLHSDIFEKNSYMSEKIMSELRNITPMCKVVSFV